MFKKIVLCLLLAVLFPVSALAQDGNQGTGYDSQLTMQIQAPADWEHTSYLYRAWGWGLFGTGLGLTVAGYSTLVYGYLDADDPVLIAGACMAAAGGIAVWVGVGLLIADAVKFNSYRDAAVVGGFQWQPEFYATPEFTGFGISGRF